MPEFYFAYGSNMNPARMRARGLVFRDYQPARLAACCLRFNKRAHNKNGVGYANIGHCLDDEVQGVLYELCSSTPIAAMDPFEGTPVRYSRELFEVAHSAGSEWAWVYVANPAFVAAELAVEENYLNHLLSAGDLLTADYRQRLLSLAPVIASETPGDTEQGLVFNV